MCWENIHNFIPRKRDSVVDGRVYELTDYEKNSLKQIEQILEKGYKDKDMVKEHVEYLNHLLNRLMGILDCERSVGAPTMNLENDVNRIKELYSKVGEIKRNFQ